MVQAPQQIKSVARIYINQGLKELCDQAMEQYIQNLGVNQQYVDKRVAEIVADEQTDYATEEFMQWYNKTSEETVQQDVKEYLQETYYIEFLVKQIEYKENEDNIRTNMEDDMCTLLKSTDPYSDLETSQWYQYVHQVRSLRELQEYLSEDSLPRFVEAYAPDWRESLA